MVVRKRVYGQPLPQQKPKDEHEHIMREKILSTNVENWLIMVNA